MTETTSRAGGARAGAGRKQMYGEPLSEVFTARVNAVQGKAIGAWCLKHKLPPATLFREVGLLRAGAESLGIGIEAAKGTAEKAIALKSVSCFPVKCTKAQAAAIRAFCTKRNLPPSSWLREAVLEFIGKPELGLRGKADALGRSLDA